MEGDRNEGTQFILIFITLCLTYQRNFMKMTGKDYTAIQTNILILFRSIFEPPKPETTTKNTIGEMGDKHITSTFDGRSTGSCICLRLDLYMPHVSLLCFYAYRLYLTCDMDKSSVRHIHDPVLLSLKVGVICYINFLAYCLSYSAFFCFLMASILVSAILVARNVITLYCMDTRTLYHGPSTADVRTQTPSEHYKLV